MSNAADCLAVDLFIDGLPVNPRIGDFSGKMTSQIKVLSTGRTTYVTIADVSFSYCYVVVSIRAEQVYQRNIDSLESWRSEQELLLRNGKSTSHLYL